MATAKAFDLNLLTVLVAIKATGSASEAAVQLGISQPSVSGALAKLRVHYNDPLFLRSRSGMVPTPRGLKLATAAADVLKDLESRLQVEDSFDPKHEARPYTFALSDVGEIVFLPVLLKRLREHSPDTMVRSVTMRPSEVSTALQSGEVDLAIGYFPDLRSADFLQQLLFTHHFVCLLREEHPIQGNRLTMTEYMALEHAVVQSEGRSQEILEAFLQSRNMTRRVALVTPHFLSLPRLIAKSNMTVAVPHAVGMAYGNSANKLRVIGLPFESPRIELKQHWHRRLHNDARNIWLRKLVSQLFNAASDEWGRPTSRGSQDDDQAARSGRKERT